MNYLTLQQTAERFGVSVKTITRLAKKREIPCTSALGPLRFPADLLDDWAKNPKEVTRRWYSGEKEEAQDDGETEIRKLGRSLFLHGCAE